MLAKSMTPSGSKYLNSLGDNPEPVTKGATTVNVGGGMLSAPDNNKTKDVTCGKHPDKAI